MTAQQLKNSILQLAVQGKLVLQNPNDEPASVLLEKIRSEKERLIKDGKLKKEKQLPPITEDEIPFDVPESWEWVRLKDLCTKIGSGSTPTGGKTVYKNHGVKFIRSQNVYDDGLRLDNVAYISEEVNQQKIGSYVHPNDILLNITGGSIGRCAIVPYNFDGANVNQHVMIIRLVNVAINRYVHCVLISSYIQNMIMGVQVGVSREGLSAAKLMDFLIPIPPHSEQKQILARIDELLSHIADYDVAEQKLTALNAVFPDQLKKSILQSAVQGKLVPQDENDEPASVLLERIRAEKEQLIKDGKIKKEKPLPTITDDEIPFDVPENWEWVRLGDIGDTNIGLTYSPSNIAKTGIAVLRSNNIKDGKINYDELVYVNVDVPVRALANTGDILICTRNGSRRLVGKTAIIEKDGMAFGAFMAIFRSELNPYIKVFLDSSVFRGQFDGVETTTINQVTQDMLKNTLIPIPPLAEQHRIVAKSEELMAMVDGLGGKS